MRERCTSWRPCALACAHCLPLTSPLILPLAWPPPLQVIDYSMLVGIHRASGTRQPSREREASRFYKVGQSGKGGEGGGREGGGREGGGGSSSRSDRRHARTPSTDRSRVLTASSGSAGGSEASGEASSGGGGGRGHEGGADSAAAAAASSSVQIVETVSQGQLHREHQRRGAGEVLPDRHSRGNEPDEPEVGKEVYFVGCIDILCEYGLKKQLEHHYKAAKHGEKVGAQNFSVVDPVQYSTRFQNFVAEALD